MEIKQWQKKLSQMKLFKIDLIVWKLCRVIYKVIDQFMFKIDLIVWKF